MIETLLLFPCGDFRHASVLRSTSRISGGLTVRLSQLLIIKNTKLLIWDFWSKLIVWLSEISQFKPCKRWVLSGEVSNMRAQTWREYLCPDIKCNNLIYNVDEKLNAIYFTLFIRPDAAIFCCQIQWGIHEGNILPSLFYLEKFRWSWDKAIVQS